MILAPIALTCGEPAGVGPEISVKAWEQLHDELAFFWIGDPDQLPDGTTWKAIESPDHAADVMPHALPVLSHDFSTKNRPGQPDARNAQNIVDVITRAVRLAQSGQASAICTNPIHKKALIDGAGFSYPGHTEFLAHLGDDADVVMMLASDQLRVVPATIHIPLTAVPGALTAELLEKTIRVTALGLTRDFGIPKPRIAVAGLNPHAGEGGAMGHEDAEIIAPVIARLRAEGLAVTGPHSADTMFHTRARERFDAAICAYHDQALIPIKTLDFDRGVNVTLGLPFIRTSPDHGTALDIAGQGIANPTSLIEALRMAWAMAQSRA